MNKDTRFKCPKTGSFLTQCLFFELQHDEERSLYTLKEYDHTLPSGRVLPSIKQLYLAERDPTEYHFAKKYFFSWQHWKRCLGNSRIANAADEWREELELLIMSEGLKGVISEATDKENYQAAKWLAEKGWVDKKVGRPTKEKQERELKLATRAKAAHDSDLARVSKFI